MLTLKKVFSILLVISIVFTGLFFTGCSKEEPAVDAFFKTYKPITATDFINLTGKEGYKTIENTDNSQIEFKKSYYITEDDKNFALIYFELENVDMANEYFSRLVQSYELFLADYSILKRFENHGSYAMVDGESIVYFSFVDNTFISSINYNDTGNPEATINELIKVVNILQYPEFEYHKNPSISSTASK